MCLKNSSANPVFDANSAVKVRMNFDVFSYGRILLVVCILWALNPAVSEAQNISGLAYELRYYRGVIFPHYKSFKSFMQGRIPSAELNIRKTLYGKKPWMHSRNYPHWGAGLFFSDLQNKDVLGKALGIHAFAEYTLTGNKHFSLKHRLSPGLVFVTKKYDIDDNAYNIALGSHFNALLKTGFTFQLNCSEKLSLSTGLSLIHFSNGALKFPNAGLNQFSLSAGLIYDLTEIKEYPSVPSDELPLHRLLISVAGGWHRYAFEDLRLYFAAGWQVEYLFRTGKTTALSFGSDLFFDNALRSSHLSRALHSDAVHYFYGGLHAGLNFYLRQLAAFFHLGHYVWKRPDETQNIYSRIGLRYEFENGISSSVSLKTYMAKADFIEWGVGFFVFRKN